MLQAFVVTLRQGLEAFLIVAVTLAFLRRTDGVRLAWAVGWGIAASVLISIGAGVLFQRAANQALWRGLLALAAAALVAASIAHTRRAAHAVKRGESFALDAPTTGALAAAFLFTVLMITRQGIETVLLMDAVLFQIRSAAVFLGALGGLAFAALLAALWPIFSRRIRAARFFQVTAIFLWLFVIQLTAAGIHEATEANIVPYSQELHEATEPYGPDGQYGQFLTYLLVVLPAGWLGFTALTGRDVHEQAGAAK